MKLSLISQGKVFFSLSHRLCSLQPTQPALGFTISTCLLHYTGWQYAVDLYGLYPLLGNYHKVMSIVAQAFGHGDGLSDSLNYNLAHLRPLNMYRLHSGYSPSLDISQASASQLIASDLLLRYLPFHFPHGSYLCLDFSLVMPIY